MDKLKFNNIVKKIETLLIDKGINNFFQLDSVMVNNNFISEYNCFDNSFSKNNVVYTYLQYDEDGQFVIDDFKVIIWFETIEWFDDIDREIKIKYVEKF